mmetsp:Transcript_3399/g.5015  ORF Transcript_3399/g.5015 Transcript_3399/m.5015 type:complete len:200 (-) Transcript_3399:95-694(-)
MSACSASSSSSSCSDDDGDTIQPVDVLYCGVCSLPIEYCSWSGSFDDCKKWLESEHPDLVDLETLESKDHSSSKSKRQQRKVQASKSGGDIEVTRLKRNKRKFVTVVKGLGTHEGVKLKAAAKYFSNKYSCSAAVIRSGGDQIDIQGDCLSTIADVICEKYPDIPKKRVIIAGNAGNKKGRKRQPGQGGRGRKMRVNLD